MTHGPGHSTNNTDAVRKKEDMTKVKRHFHAGKKTIVVDGVEFTSVREWKKMEVA